MNASLTLLYWSIGDQVRRSVLGTERAAYGERIFAILSRDLLAEFGRGFELTNLTRMVKFAEEWGDCCDAVATIELVPLPGAASACQAAAAGVLR